MPSYQVAIVPVTLFQQNCTLVWERDTRRAAVIDPGGEPGRILDAIMRFGLEVELILLTHGHLDHAGGAKALKGLFDAARDARGQAPVPIWGPDERDAPLLQQIEEQQKTFNMTGLRNVEPDRWLREGDVVELGTLRFEVLHVPGHTPGHIVFVERTQRIAFVGDTVFKGGVGRTDFPGGDHALLMAGITQKLLPLGDDISFVCGHGAGSTFGIERADNPFLRQAAS
jgi:glyoxylase-like metal-dependent hydrolase (beta-lactamase superfamily II)